MWFIQERKPIESLLLDTSLFPHTSVVPLQDVQRQPKVCAIWHHFRTYSGHHKNTHRYVQLTNCYTIM